ncbi:uncharacterized protein LOC110988294 isoform X2 [Acanthaster planci]|uniref:Uncharacterized protein LOC110988294 isoform X2 n=1 Tax=Acanthaster planci TaxID=133434 RepID=A0A8B7ZQL0_ACAPL|nr:uncharacterized protein LOC110988294 isoform X2 [Acanthaster planci]
MDVLVKWSDGSQNIVYSEHLKYKPPLNVNKAVKMKWGRVWWRGRVLDFEESTENDEDTSDSTDSDDVPISTRLSTTKKVAASCFSPHTPAPCNSPRPEAAARCSESSCTPEDATSISTTPAPCSSGSSECVVSNSVLATATTLEDNIPEATPGHSSRTVSPVDAAPISNPHRKPAESCSSSSYTPDDTANCSISASEVVLGSNSSFLTEGAPASSSGSTCTSPGIINAHCSPNGLMGAVSSSADNTAVQDNGRVQTCSNFSCHKEIFAACSICHCLVCFEHFVNSDSRATHNLLFDIFEGHAGIKACTNV